MKAWVFLIDPELFKYFLFLEISWAIAEAKGRNWNWMKLKFYNLGELPQRQKYFASAFSREELISIQSKEYPKQPTSVFD